MKAIVVTRPGGTEVLQLRDVPDPQPGNGEVLIRVAATALNRADLLQRMGRYPPPPGASELLGLEAAGTVEAVGPEVAAPTAGARVMALLPGGGYAEKVVVPAGMAMAVPDRLSLEHAAAVPEAFLTAYLELVMLGGLAAGQTVLIHGGASGVGTAAIQIARELGMRVMTTAGSSAKLEACRRLGAEVAVNYRTESFVERIREATGGRGVDVILDLVGAVNWVGNITSLAVGGRLLLVGTPSGAKAEIDFGPVMAKRLSIIGSTLRSRPLAEKLELTRCFAEFGLPRLADGRLTPVIDRVFPLAEAAEAHRHMESNANIGKIVLRVGG